MKDKILYVIIGILTVAIIVMGVVMVMDKRNARNADVPNGRQMGPGRNGPTFTMGPDFDPANLPEGAEFFTDENGGHGVRVRVPNGGGPAQQRPGM